MASFLLAFACLSDNARANGCEYGSNDPIDCGFYMRVAKTNIDHQNCYFTCVCTTPMPQPLDACVGYGEDLGICGGGNDWITMALSMSGQKS